MWDFHMEQRLDWRLKCEDQLSCFQNLQQLQGKVVYDVKTKQRGVKQAWLTGEVYIFKKGVQRVAAVEDYRA